MTNYSNGNSVIKDIVRNMLSSELLSQRNIIKVLSLPADTFLFEKTLEEMYPDKEFIFTCLEMDNDTWSNGSKLLRTGFIKSDMDYLNISTSEFLEDVKNRNIKFDIIWYDYCSQYSKPILNDLNKTIDIIHDNTLVGITLMGRRESKKITGPLLENTGKRNPTLQHVREISMPKEMAEALHLPTLKMIRYVDKLQNSRAAPMYLYMFGENEQASVPIVRLVAEIEQAAQSLVL